jgi:glyoxylase I family protein
MDPMLDLALHHASVPTGDLNEAARFYEGILGLRRMPRPAFTVGGIWYAVGDRQIHVVVHLNANFRSLKAVDNDDVHFALYVKDFEKAYEHLRSHGYNEELPADHSKRMILKRSGLAGFPQLFVMDPDHNIVEINHAPLS